MPEWRAIFCRKCSVLGALLAGMRRVKDIAGAREGETRASAVILLAAFVASVLVPDPARAAAGQTATDGRTPAGMDPGGPAGSYALSDFETVDLFSGNVNFALLLQRVIGRGAAEHPIILGVRRHWPVEKVVLPDDRLGAHE